MLMRSPPHWRYMMLSARVLNCGPSMQTIVLPVWSFTPFPWTSSALCTCSSSHAVRRSENGSPNAACATTDVPSKKLTGRTPFVRSITCAASAKSPGAISSRSEPTAEKARITRAPSDFSAATFARAGTAEGAMVWPGPCRARKATRVPDGSAQMVMGDEGSPHGCGTQEVS
jgi:hypothetical protein